MNFLKSFWLLAVAVLILVGNTLPAPLLILFVILALAAPLIREFRKNTDLDERQIQIGHLSSHIAYFAFSALLLIVMAKEKFSAGKIEIYWYILLLVPMLLKLIICTVQSYGPVKGGIKGIFHLFFRGIVKSKLVDERQHDIGNFSSHIAYYLYTALVLFFIIFKFSAAGKEPANVWFMLLLVPIIIKFFVNLFKNYGWTQGARFICYAIAGFWLMFVLLSHGLSLSMIIEASPFLLLLTITYFSNRFPLITGIFFIILAMATIFFFSGWMKNDIYQLILMYSLIPLPILLSGLAFLISAKQKR